MSIFLLAAAVQESPGAVGTALLGILLFGEPGGGARLVCLGLAVAGVAGLKLVSPR